LKKKVNSGNSQETGAKHPNSGNSQEHGRYPSFWPFLKHFYGSFAQYPECPPPLKKSRFWGFFWGGHFLHISAHSPEKVIS